MPSERSAKSAIVVPKVVEVAIVAQYRNGWNFFAAICMATSKISAERKIAHPMRYPLLTMTSALSQVMVTVSPAVSPSVVARILIIQKPRVTSGTLLA